MPLSTRVRVEGCYSCRGLGLAGAYAAYTPYSRANGAGPTLEQTWLVCPVYRRREVIALIWADDPEDRLAPRARHPKALRMFANQATTGSTHGAVEEMRFQRPRPAHPASDNRRSFRLGLSSRPRGPTPYGTRFAGSWCATSKASRTSKTVRAPRSATSAIEPRRRDREACATPMAAYAWRGRVRS